MTFMGRIAKLASMPKADIKRIPQKRTLPMAVKGGKRTCNPLV